MLYSHAPAGYLCPFCLLVRGIADTNSPLKRTDIISQTPRATAFMATRKWPNNVGHVLVIPNEHFENIYDLPASIAAEIHSLARNIALAMKAEYPCDGITLKQNNEPAGDQHIWHYHLHLIPRYQNDHFPNAQKEFFPADQRAEFARKLRNWLENQEAIEDERSQNL